MERVGRLHPAFLLADKGLIENTDKNFSAMPPQYDHFGLFSEQLEKQVNPAYLEDLAPGKWSHMAGLTYNYMLLMRGEKPNFKIEKFKEYNQQILALGLNVAPNFLPFVRAAAEIEIK